MMVAVIPIIIAAIVAIAQLLGITFIAYKLERNGAFDSAAVAVKQAAAAGGKVAQSGANLLDPAAGVNLLLVGALIVGAVILIRR